MDLTTAMQCMQIPLQCCSIGDWGPEEPMANVTDLIRNSERMGWDAPARLSIRTAENGQPRSRQYVTAEGLKYTALRFREFVLIFADIIWDF